jgi:hypothetical protein
MSDRWAASSADGAALQPDRFEMCTLTQRELDFLASLNAGWQRLYPRELARLLKDDAEPGDVQRETRIVWRVGSGLSHESVSIQDKPVWWNRHS